MASPARSVARPLARVEARFGSFGWVVVATVLGAAGARLTIAHQWFLWLLILTLAVAAAFVRAGFVVLLVVVLLTPGDRTIVQFFTVTGGALALALVMRGLPSKRVILPWAAFVLLALASVRWPPRSDIEPSFPHIVPLIHSEYVPPYSSAATEWLAVTLALIMFMLAGWFVRDVRRLQRLVAVVLVGSLWPIADGLKQLATPGYQPASADATVLNARSNYHAIQSVFSHPNPFGFYLVLVLLLAAVALFEVKRPQLKFLVGLLLVAAGVCLLKTYTRSAWVGFATGLLLLGIWRYRLLLLAAAVALPLSAYAAPTAVREVSKRFGDLSSKNEANANNSWNWRTTQWGRMWHWGAEKPLTGQGFGSYRRTTVKEFGLEDRRFKTLLGPAQGLGFTAHNDFVKSFVELGWPGLFLWIFVLLGLISAMVSAARAPGVRPWASAMAVVVVVMAGMSYSDNLQASYAVATMMLMATVAGGVAGAAWWTRSQNQPAG
jgi:O-antigen ligase